MDEVVFTPGAVLSLLTQIEELKDYDIGINDGVDGKLQVTIGESTYNIDTGNIVEVDVDDGAIADVEYANQDAYSSLYDSGEIDLELEPINSGILSKVGKAAKAILVIGGLVRLTSKFLK